ncbi:unnamed protein product [Dibothriocephalus latus]|uniref:Uncharacterized protein n=1 Tax=Dibothriocephalus latus TaxID=60516 RepID=A0A3P7N3P2_DIBLA|nr:unnamed protein product [Dibothriocephalus latus]
MRRAASNLSSLGRIRELWSGLEQASLMRRLATRLGEESQLRAIDDFLDKMTRIADWSRASYPTTTKVPRELDTPLGNQFSLLFTRLCTFATAHIDGSKLVALFSSFGNCALINANMFVAGLAAVAAIV